MSKIILVNPNYFEQIYGHAMVRAGTTRGLFNLGLLCIAAPLLKAGHSVKLVDLNVDNKSNDYLADVLREFHADFVGITATTPLIKSAYAIASVVKSFDPSIKVITGGPHSTAMPEAVLNESVVDCVVTGEGDLILKQVVEEGFSPSIPNLYYKDGCKIIASKDQGHFIANLNDLPFPSYDLLDSSKYSQSPLLVEKNPVAYLETSRGCYAKCSFCNKNIHGYKMRMKTPGRVVDEIEHFLGNGFREIHFIDDNFTADLRRAGAICEEILRRGLRFPWVPRGGLRVDRVTPELLSLMKKAGCHRAPFGVESGSQRIIDSFGKMTTLDQARNAVKWAKQAGLETEAYFMIGLPGETEQDLEKTIQFAVELDPDFVKFATAIPLPGTTMFETMEKNGHIKTRDWEKYDFAASPRELYTHDSLSWEVLDSYSKKAYKAFYFRPLYILKTIWKTTWNGHIFDHIRGFMSTNWRG